MASTSGVLWGYDVPKPKLVGYFSVSKKGVFLNDMSGLRYVDNKKKHHLPEALENNDLLQSENEHLLRFLITHEGIVEHGSNFNLDQAKFVLPSNTLRAIMRCYEKPNQKMLLEQILFAGNIYSTDYFVDELNAKREVEEFFLEQAFVDLYLDKSDKNFQERTSYLYGVYELKTKNNTIVYSSRIDGVIETLRALKCKSGVEYLKHCRKVKMLVELLPPTFSGEPDIQQLVTEAGLQIYLGDFSDVFIGYVDNDCLWTVNKIKNIFNHIDYYFRPDSINHLLDNMTTCMKRCFEEKIITIEAHQERSIINLVVHKNINCTDLEVINKLPSKPLPDFFIKACNAHRRKKNSSYKAKLYRKKLNTQKSRKLFE